MLRQLAIEDYGLIPRAEVGFSNGATIFTGETGSGKTMVLGAIAFALGERSSAENVRRGAARAAVTLEFDPDVALRERLAVDGYPLDSDENATIVRELTDAGKSSLRLNGRSATAGYVREIAPFIADVVGQHEAQRLLSPAYHVELLDRFAGSEATTAVERVASLHAGRLELLRELQTLESGERRAAEQFAFAKYALEEIDAVAPQEGEDERLSDRRRLLDNAERVANALRAAHEALAGDDGSASDALGAASASLAQVQSVAQSLADLAQATAALQSEAGELAVRAARELDAIEFDPEELEAINARLEALDTLKRKYGGTIAAVLASATEFRETSERFGNVDERKAQLRRDLEDATAQLEEAAEHLSRVRHGAAARLRKAVETELKDLALASARFAVQFEPLPEIGPGGGEHVEFVFAANKGEAERPLARVASGGELSRVLLAVIVVLAQARGRTALIFDEIDAGIGGATATAVAERLSRLARHAQVVCVTHLAQIASRADTHYVLEKSERKNAAVIEVRAVDGEPARAGEIARMLSGETHDAALKHARTLLRGARA